MNKHPECKEENPDIDYFCPKCKALVGHERLQEQYILNNFVMIICPECNEWTDEDDWIANIMV